MNPSVITLDEQTAATIRELASAEQRPETEIVRDALRSTSSRENGRSPSAWDNTATGRMMCRNRRGP